MSNNVKHINPRFKNEERAAYELGNLLRKLPSHSTDLAGASTKKRQMAEAAAMHAENANGTLLAGIEAIGKLLFIAGANDDWPVERETIADLGALISHLAVEAQFLQETKHSLKFGLSERARKMRGGEE